MRTIIRIIIITTTNKYPVLHFFIHSLSNIHNTFHYTLVSLPPGTYLVNVYFRGLSNKVLLSHLIPPTHSTNRKRKVDSALCTALSNDVEILFETTVLSTLRIKC